MSLPSLTQSKQKKCSCSALLQHFLCLSLKALHHYPLLGTFLLRLGESGPPEQVWSRLRFRHCRLDRIPEARVCEDRGACIRIEWGSEWGPKVWSVSKPTCQSQRSCYHEGLWCRPFLFLHPLLTKWGPEYVWTFFSSLGAESGFGEMGEFAGSVLGEPQEWVLKVHESIPRTSQK